MIFDAMDQRYFSRRNVVFGKHGMAATGQHLAAQAGLVILKKGGSAADAAVAMAIALTVVEPTSNGVGGDAFAIVSTKNAQQALDAPRWQWIGGKDVLVERTFSSAMLEALKARGHAIRYSDDVWSFGRGQIILRDENGVYTGGTDPRTDGAVLGY